MAEILRLVPSEIDKMPVRDLHAELQKLSRADRTSLLSQCEGMLQNKVGGENQVLASKALVALLPDSFSAIEDLLRRRESSEQHEVHFSLFLFLGDMREFCDRKLGNRVLGLLRDYLLTIRSEAALASRQAGDAIASWWPAEESVPALRCAAEEGRYVAGRLGALVGLEEVLGSSSAERRAEIESIIRRMCFRDRSSRVRNVASFALGSER